MTTTEHAREADHDEAVRCDRGDGAPANGWRDTADGTEFLCAPHFYEPQQLAPAAVQGYWDAIADGESVDDALGTAYARDFNDGRAAEAIEQEEAARQAAWLAEDTAGASAADVAEAGG